MLSFTRQDFPDDFLFGTATSSYQIEGHAFGGAGKTHWDTFAATPGNVVRAETGGRACDHLHRWKEDLDLVQAAGLDVYEEEHAVGFFEDQSASIIQDDTFARLLTFPNVLITAHQAFFTAEALQNIAETTMANLTAFEETGTPVHEVGT